MPPASADSILAACLQKQRSPTKAHKLSFKPSSADATRPLAYNNADWPPAQEQHRNRAHAHGQRFFSSEPPAAREVSLGGGASLSLDQEASSSIVRLQRKLLACFYIYATVIIALYLTYAVYCYYQQGQFRRQQLESQQASQQAPAGEWARQEDSAPAAETAADRAQLELAAKLESKVHLLERYLEVLALDLEATKTRLSEREKCACSLNCSFNGTRYSEGQEWRHKCDVCACRTGKISCVARECPKLKCALEADAVVQLRAGQCCPSCMKKCKVNGTFVKHGDSFKSAAGADSTKTCSCHDGLLRCSSADKLKTRDSGSERPRADHATSRNKTLEYVKSILAPAALAPGRQ